MRELVKLVCTECGEENYHTDKNKKATPDRLEFSKYCPRDRKHTLHREKK
ncbi:MAG: 50S ribosomal protein L33 [Candidatus Phytoplasma sp.]|nr:50S ribosomal protein L33 [Phytoplasma sp.]